MDRPFVSIIVPVYNGERTLGRCLEAILSQGYSSFELIVVDNHSTDKTKSIIEDYQGRFNRLKYLFEPQRSRGAARNAGIRVAVGEIILMTDSDCIVPDHWIDQMIAPIINDGESIVMGSEEDVVNNFWSSQIQRLNDAWIKRISSGQYVASLDTKNFAIKTDIMKHFMFDPEIGNLEDFEFALRIRPQIKIRYLPDVKVGHHHKTTFLSWAKLNYNRGYWGKKIYLKHKSNPLFENEPMFESMKGQNAFMFPFWITWHLLRNPGLQTWFVCVSDLSWRLGLLAKRG